MLLHFFLSNSLQFGVLINYFPWPRESLDTSGRWLNEPNRRRDRHGRCIEAPVHLSLQISSFALVEGRRAHGDELLRLQMPPHLGSRQTSACLRQDHASPPRTLSLCTPCLRGPSRPPGSSKELGRVLDFEDGIVLLVIQGTRDAQEGAAKRGRFVRDSPLWQTCEEDALSTAPRFQH